MLVDYGTGDGCGAGRNCSRDIVLLFDKTNKNMNQSRTEFNHKGRFIGFEPGINYLGTHNCGGLHPALIVWRHGRDAILAGSEIFNGNVTVRSGNQGLITGYNRAAVNIENRIAIYTNLIGRAQEIAEYVCCLRAGRSPIGPPASSRIMEKPLISPPLSAASS